MARAPKRFAKEDTEITEKRRSRQNSPLPLCALCVSVVEFSGCPLPAFAGTSFAGMTNVGGSTQSGSALAIIVPCINARGSIRHAGVASSIFRRAHADMARKGAAQRVGVGEAAPHRHLLGGIVAALQHAPRRRAARRFDPGG